MEYKTIFEEICRTIKGGQRPKKIKISPLLYKKLKAECDNLLAVPPKEYTTLLGMKYEVDENIEEFELVYD